MEKALSELLVARRAPPLLLLYSLAMSSALPWRLRAVIKVWSFCTFLTAEHRVCRVLSTCRWSRVTGGMFSLAGGAAGLLEGGCPALPLATLVPSPGRLSRRSGIPPRAAARGAGSARVLRARPLPTMRSWRLVAGCGP